MSVSLIVTYLVNDRLNAAPEFDTDNRLVVYSDGTVSWVPIVAHKIRCDIEDDILDCTLKFGSWTYDGSKVKT